MYNLRANDCNSTPAVICGAAEDKEVTSHLFTPSAKPLLLHKSAEKLLLPWWDRIKSPAWGLSGCAQRKAQTHRCDWEQKHLRERGVDRERFHTPKARPQR